ncbi:MAG: peroxidase family protein [Burkholderiaceae bacterium]
MSLWSNIAKPAAADVQGPVCDYVSWPGLTDRSFSSRHLPPLPQADVDALPANIADPVTGKPGPVTALFDRGDGPMKTDRSSLLFAYFAQWFTDSFLRTAPVDRRRNTSNHEIDLCQIYGLTEDVTRMLRTGHGGLLNSQIIGDQEYLDPLYETAADGSLQPKAKYARLPQVVNGTLDWIVEQQKIPTERKARLYATGLERGNSSIGYVVMSTLFVREHNRLAANLATLNAGWDDERVFQTARIINIVMLLRIVVEDYINHIAGHDIFVLDNSYAEDQSWYRTNWMAIEFDMLYRWHGLIPDAVTIAGKTYGPTDFQTNNVLLEQLGIETIIDGASHEVAGEIALFNTPKFLLPAEDATLKMGRDFRVQGFNAYRARFGLARLAGWDDLTSDDKVKGALKALYRDIDQVELFVGLMAEESKDGALFGLLLNTMVASDAFTQALTNPLLSRNVFTEANFTRFGLGEIAATPSLQALVDRNVLGGSNVKASFAA